MLFELEVNVYSQYGNKNHKGGHFAITGGLKWKDWKIQLQKAHSKYL